MRLFADAGNDAIAGDYIKCGVPDTICATPHNHSRTRLFFYFDDIYGLYSVCAIPKFELYGTSLRKGFESLFNDTRIVNKNLFSIFGNNKSVTLLAVEPFYFSGHKFQC